MTASFFDELCECLKADQLTAWCTIIAGPDTGAKALIKGDGTVLSNFRSDWLLESVRARAEELMEAQRSERLSLEKDPESWEVLIEVYPPAPKLLIIGAVHVAIPLITFARALGFNAVVVDPRSAFATPERFSHADRLIVAWPQQALRPSDFNESTYLVALSHDERLDIPALKMALESKCRYVGALGSRKTHQKRVRALSESGLSEQQIGRIHAPIGLKLGGRSAAETAVSIIAQIVAVKNGQPA